MKRSRRYVDGLLDTKFWNGMRSHDVMVCDQRNKKIALYADGGQLFLAIRDHDDSTFMALHVEEADQLVAMVRQERPFAMQERKKILRDVAKENPKRRNGRREVS